MLQPKPLRARFLVAALCVGWSGTALAQGQERGVVFAGGTIAPSSSAYVGTSVALPGGALGRGPALRVVGSWSEFNYTSGATSIDGRSAGIAVAGVYQWSGSWGYANISAGVAYRDTDLSPDDPGNPNRGTQWDGVVGVDGMRNLGDWRVGGLASYGFNLEEYYARLELTRAVSGTLRLGAEGVAQGDPNFERQQLGALVAFAPAPRWEVRLSAGAFFEDTGDGAYGAVALSRTF